MIATCGCPSDSLLHRHGCTLGLAGIAGDGSPARFIGVCPACATEIHGEALEDPSTPFCSVRCANTFTAPEIVAYLDAERFALGEESPTIRWQRRVRLAERPRPSARDRVMASLRRRGAELPGWLVDAMVVAIAQHAEAPCCLACAREVCADAGFPGIDREQAGHSCGPSGLDDHRRFRDCAYTLDDEPVDLEDFLHVNEESLSREQVEEIKHMMPGDSLLLGGGAGATFTLTRTR